MHYPRATSLQLRTARASFRSAACPSRPMNLCAHKGCCQNEGDQRGQLELRIGPWSEAERHHELRQQIRKRGVQEGGVIRRCALRLQVQPAEQNKMERQIADQAGDAILEPNVNWRIVDHYRLGFPASDAPGGVG